MKIPFTYTDMNACFALRRYFFSFLLMLGPMLAVSQVRPLQVTPDTSKGEFIIIDYLGNFIEDKQGIETVKWISNGLQLRIDSTYIYADSAVIFGEDRLLHAYGNVVIQQGDSISVFTDTLYYLRETDVADLVGEVTLVQGSKQLWTRNLKYHLASQYGEYAEGGVLVDKDLQVSSKRGVYFADNEEVQFKDSVIVLHPEFNLAADSMRYLGSESMVKFTGPTNIYTPTANIYCESGFYDLRNETAEFNQKAQYAGDQKRATADTIRRSGNGEVLMIGNVHVEENDKRIDGDKLRYLEKTGETWITGNPARYSDLTRKSTGSEIFYNEHTNQVSTVGRGEMRDGSMILVSDQWTFDQSTGLGNFKGDVVWRDTVRNVGIITENMDMSEETEYVLAYGEKRSLFFTIVDGDTLYIAADTLNMQNQIDTVDMPDTVRLITAYHDVRLFKSDLQGKADSLVFNDTDSLFSFFGDPVLWSDTTQFSADSITMSIRNNQLNDITLTQKAIIISELYETYYDQIKGKIILAQFDSSAIKDMWVFGNAESIYYTRDEKTAFIGVNQTICSKMYFTFLAGQIHLLKYFGENSSTMKPMGEAEHDALRLEGFRWRASERPHHVNDLLK